MTLPSRSRVSPRSRKSFLQKLYSRHSAGAVIQTEPDVLPSREAPTTRAIPLDFLRNIEQPPLLLIVPEHACPCGYSRCRGFIASKSASDAKVDGDEALYLPCLYDFLRSDANKNWLWPFFPFRSFESHDLRLAAWTRGASWSLCYSLTGDEKSLSWHARVVILWKSGF